MTADKMILIDMIQSRLRELMAKKGREERRRVTYDDILARTGISTNTLTRMANGRAGGVAFSTVERLCRYFDCQPGDLFVFVDDQERHLSDDITH